jgi:hypothetical protein
MAEKANIAMKQGDLPRQFRGLTVRVGSVSFMRETSADVGAKYHNAPETVSRWDPERL